MPLDGVAPATPSVLAEILDGGQSFRWSPSGDGWRGVFGGEAVELSAAPDGRLSFSCLHGEDTTATAAALRDYLDGNGDPLAAADRLPHRSDPALAAAMAPFPGLRILRQPFADALIGFICSANANIPRIKGMVASLAERFGEPIAPGLYATPTWARLAVATDEEIAPCKLGYRAAFIRGAARMLVEDSGFEARVRAMPSAETRVALMTLPGVGPKVADCVRLFGLGQTDGFPVDTWIRKVMDMRYGLDDWTNAQVVRFATVHFGTEAGLAQQFLFASARRGL